MAKVKCPQCLTVNPDGKETCIKCNAPLPRIRIEAMEARRPPARPQNTTEFRQGQIVARRYTIQNLIGRGGMGSIYQAQDNVLGEPVALKTLLPQFVRDKLIVDRFFNEARIARKLSHPNIVRVHDIGQAEDQVYISMELIKGKSLRALLDQVPDGKRLPVRQVIHILIELCDALEYAHQYTIHRDIKPENVMLQDGGRIKLMDFGISKLMTNTRLTGASVVMGTPFYMSPEQLRNSRDVDARADIFSVGIMMYEMLTGNLPTGVPKPASQLYGEVPPNMDQIIAKCVATEPGQRFQNAKELREALCKIQNILETGAAAPPVVKKSVAPALPWRKLAGGLLIAVIVAAMVLGISKSEQHRRALAAASPAVSFEKGTERAIDPLELLTVVQAQTRGNAAADTALLEQGDVFADHMEDPFYADSIKDQARYALQCYLAALMKNSPETEGMVFVPPGNVLFDDTTLPVDAFFIDATEVSQVEYKTFCEQMEWPIGGDFAAADIPMTWVAWYDAQAYAAWKGKQLPTSTQWLRAAYGEKVTGFPWGADWQEAAANTAESDGFDGLSPVGHFDLDRSPFGCQDMTGNACEWTRSPASGQYAAVEPFFGTTLWVCGGDYLSRPDQVYRPREVPFEMRSEVLGFRCVLQLPDTTQAIREFMKNRR